MRKTTVVTDCGHQFKTCYKAEVLSGRTMDCRVCGKLLVFPSETTIGSCVRGREFPFLLARRFRTIYLSKP